jgi:hypothetical protein
LLENTNANDIRSFHGENFSEASYDLFAVNKILARRGLPIIKVYDEGYNKKVNGVKTFKRFIPDGKSVVVGKRPMNQKVGAVAMTPSLHRVKNGQPAPGMFAFAEVNGQPNTGVAVIDVELLGSAANPRIKVTGGFYGGPLIRFGRSVIRKNLY